MLKVLAPVMLLAACAVPASALPLVQDAVSTGSGGVPIIRVYDGCGPYGHRGPYGYCRTGGQWGGYVRGASCPVASADEV
ncbi:GCG_CRPN prefix-to-repeats domain-containing protein [Methylobacterium symbioticum]